MGYVGRVIQTNAYLCDGTPRREKGHRAIVQTYGPEPHPNPALQGVLMKKFHKSPLFQSRQEAEEWMPQGMEKADC